MKTADAFGGHARTVEAIREHRKWHDESQEGKASVCWKEAEYVRWLLEEVVSRVSLEEHAAADHSMFYRGGKALGLMREYPGIFDDTALFAWEQKVSGLLNDEDQHSEGPK